LTASGAAALLGRVWSGCVGHAGPIG
jgi:hypothetical protein